MLPGLASAPAHLGMPAPSRSPHAQLHPVQPVSCMAQPLPQMAPSTVSQDVRHIGLRQQPEQLLSRMFVSQHGLNLGMPYGAQRELERLHLGWQGRGGRLVAPVHQASDMTSTAPMQRLGMPSAPHLAETQAQQHQHGHNLGTYFDYQQGYNLEMPFSPDMPAHTVLTRQHGAQPGPLLRQRQQQQAAFRPPPMVQSQMVMQSPDFPLPHVQPAGSLPAFLEHIQAPLPHHLLPARQHTSGISLHHDSHEQQWSSPLSPYSSAAQHQSFQQTAHPAGFMYAVHAPDMAAMPFNMQQVVQQVPGTVQLSDVSQPVQHLPGIVQPSGAPRSVQQVPVAYQQPASMVLLQSAHLPHHATHTTRPPPPVVPAGRASQHHLFPYLMQVSLFALCFVSNNINSSCCANGSSFWG